MMMHGALEADALCATVFNIVAYQSRAPALEAGVLEEWDLRR